MDYKRVYDSLILSRMLEKDNRIKLKKELKVYFERHHIIPKSLGGIDHTDNIAYLTAREHFIAHWLLWRIHKNRAMSLAFHKMISNNSNQNRYYNSLAYQEARESFSLTQIGNKYGVGQKKVISIEHRKINSEKMKNRFVGEKNYFYGKKHSEESRKKISNRLKLLPIEKRHNYRGEKIIHKNGIEIIRFKTVKQCAEFTRCSESNIRHVLAGNQKTANGYFVQHTIGLDDRIAKFNLFYSKLKTV